MNINYGIMVLDTTTDDEGLCEIVHFCGYEAEPTEHDFDLLEQELATDESFGLVGCTTLIFAHAPEDVVQLYKEMI